MSIIDPAKTFIPEEDIERIARRVVELLDQRERAPVCRNCGKPQFKSDYCVCVDGFRPREDVLKRKV